MICNWAIVRTHNWVWFNVSKHSFTNKLLGLRLDDPNVNIFPAGWRNSSPGHQCNGCNIFDLMSLLDTRKSLQLSLWLAVTLMEHSSVVSEVLLGLSSCLWCCPQHRRWTECHCGLWTSLEKFGEVLSSSLIINQKILVFPCWHAKWAKC